MKEKTISRTIKCGKIDWNRTGRRINDMEIELELEYKNGKPCFSCYGWIWNARHTDIIVRGSHLDEIFAHPETEKYREIKELYDRWHMNDSKAGSPKQEEIPEEELAKIMKWLEPDWNSWE